MAKQNIKTTPDLDEQMKKSGTVKNHIEIETKKALKRLAKNN